MSSSEQYDGDATIIKTKSPATTVNKTEVSGPKSEPKHELKDVGKELGKDLGKVSQGALSTLGGFRTFILRGNVVDLAIGIVIGAAFTTLVNSLVSDLITPLIPVPNAKGLSTAFVSIPWTGGKFQYGSFINTVISFLIVAAVLYFFVVQPVNSLMKLYHSKESEDKATRDCPYCYQAVNHKATRCPYCTSRLVEEKEKHEAEPTLLLPESLEKLSDQLAEKIATRARAKLEHTSESDAVKE